MKTFAKVERRTLRELIRLSLAAHSGFHGSTGRRLADLAAEGCEACAAIDSADQVLQQLDGRTDGARLLELPLAGKGPHS
jgi:hypothetical protein